MTGLNAKAASTRLAHIVGDSVLTIFGREMNIDGARAVART